MINESTWNETYVSDEEKCTGAPQLNLFLMMQFPPMLLFATLEVSEEICVK